MATEEAAKLGVDRDTYLQRYAESEGESRKLIREKHSGSDASDLKPLFEDPGPAETVIQAGIHRGIADDVKKQRLEELSGIDPLTGLLNRRAFKEKLITLQRSIRRFEESTNSSFGQRKDDTSEIPAPPHYCLIQIDVDKFKSINDKLGHGVGDEVLKRIAKAVSTTLREGDSACRFGGDELIVAVQSNISDACRIAERIQSAVRSINPQSLSTLGKPRDPQDGDSSGLNAVTLSIGIAPYMPHLENHMKAADLGELAAKGNFEAAQTVAQELNITVEGQDDGIHRDQIWFIDRGSEKFDGRPILKRYRKLATNAKADASLEEDVA